ncbi:hypothetical protein D3C81_1647500 [compost metagenome]
MTWLKMDGTEKNIHTSCALMDWKACEGAVFLSGFCMSRNHQMNWLPHQRETLLVAQVSDIGFLVTLQRLKS